MCQNVNYRPILEYKPLTQAEEQRLRTEYYTNNNRVGYEKLYYAVRQPNGQTSTGKDACFFGGIWQSAGR